VTCSKNMARCPASCLHYKLVAEYRAIRSSQEDDRDAKVGTYGPGSEEWDDYPALITFKEWLIQMKGNRNEDC
jgi:hypothetical protein